MTLLETINTSIEKIGMDSNVSQIPVLPVETQVLKGKKIVYVDDVKNLLSFFTPYLVTATGEEIFLIEYKNEKLDELVKNILSFKPEIILLDYNLSRELKGGEVFSKLKEKEFEGIVIGFSTLEYKDSFLNSGVDSFVSKNTSDPELTIEKIAEEVEKLTNK